MKWVVWFLLVCVILGTFAFWLGWGCRKHWSIVTGWAALSAEELAWERFSKASYEKTDGHPELQWFGHSTIGISWNDRYLLTDPVISGRVKLAPRLFDQPCLDETMPVDAILISHAHMDHLDNASLERLLPTIIYLPSGSERFLSETVLKRHTVIPVKIRVPFSVGGA